MNKKVKVLIAPIKNMSEPKKRKVKKGTMTLDGIIESQVPDTYDFIHGFGVEDNITKIALHQPEIVFIIQNKPMDGLDLLTNIKLLHPSTVVFIFMFEIVDDEQETTDAYMAAGAYRCCFPPLNIDQITHDMHVALNLE